MTQEDKSLLLQDLSARLPYGVKVQYDNEPYNVDYVSVLYEEIKLDIPDNYTIEISEIKPYLRRMSSMTEEEYNEYRNIDNRSYSCPMAYAHIPASARIDWFNAHHFDYRGLIEKGLALEAHKDMYKFK